jgi:transcriptional regulator GlxA family with amidase domain
VTKKVINDNNRSRKDIGRRVMAKISFIVDDGCSFSGVSGLIDSFNIANLWYGFNAEGGAEPLFETEILSRDGMAVRVTGGFQVVPDGSFNDLEKTDVVIVPPFLPGVELLREQSKDMLDLLAMRYEKGESIATLCTGTFVLAETGLLDGRLATTNWLYARRFRKRFPRVNLKPDHVLTQDRGLICTGNATAYYNLGLHIIEAYGSKRLASVCSKSLLIDPSRTSQASYTIFNVHKSHGDDGVLKAQEWLESHLMDKVSMEDLARNVGISTRHFIRRFKKATGESPVNYLQQLRIETAKNILETKNATVDEIAQNIGYENSSTFRKLFKEHTGLSPREYRDRFTRR